MPFAVFAHGTLKPRPYTLKRKPPNPSFFKPHSKAMHPEAQKLKASFQKPSPGQSFKPRHLRANLPALKTPKPKPYTPYRDPNYPQFAGNDVPLISITQKDVL